MKPTSTFSCEGCGQRYTTQRSLTVHLTKCKLDPKKTDLPAPKFAMAPYQSQWSVRNLNEKLLSGRIELDVEYQRDFVWDDYKKQALIWSIYDNMPISPVLFSLDKDGRYICIDGKQRLSTIRDFLAGAFKISHGGLPLNLLQHEAMRAQILDRNLGVVAYGYYLTDDECRSIFNVVQNSVPLTKGELINPGEDGDARKIKDIYAKVKDKIDVYGAARCKGLETVRFTVEWYLGIKTKPKEGMSDSYLIDDDAVNEMIEVIDIACDLEARITGRGKPRVIVLRYVISQMRKYKDEYGLEDFADQLVKTVTDAIKADEKCVSSHAAAKKIEFEYIE